MSKKPVSQIFACVLLFLLGLTVVLPVHRVQGADFTVQVWRPVEVTLTSNVTYGNPYKDVEVSATFSGPGGVVMTMPGYWDGGQTWKIRFSPTRTGSWTYSTNSTDVANAGLNNQSGSIAVTAYAGNLPIYQRGFLRISANNRYMTYNDGTPFYWLGDTSWGGLSNATRLNESNDPSYSSMFRGIIDRRVQQGYTVWKAETFANNDEGSNPPANEGGSAWTNGFFNQLNPAFWQNIDERLQYVADKGLVMSLAQGIGRSMTNASGETEHKRLARYLLARYGAYPVVWITAQEYDDFGACGACWANVAEYVYNLDPYKHPNSLHNGPSNPIAYHDREWYNFVTLQQAHGRADPVDYWLNQYNATPARPIVEDEANYEDIIPAYANVQKWQVRQSAYMSQIGGGFGFTYGGQGIWFGCYTADDPNFNCGNGNGSVGRAWYQTLDFEVGGFQMTYMKAFFTSFDWWTLSPDGGAITWSGAPTNSQKPYQKSSASRAVTVAYLPQAPATYTGTLNGLNSERTYRARWFNPRSAGYAIINGAISGVSSWSVPAQPNTEDWVLIVDDVTNGVPVPTPTPTPNPGDTSLVTSVNSLGTLRNNYTGFVGTTITVGSNPITVTQLGRYFIAGNNATHELRITRASDGALVASTLIDMSTGSADALGFKYVSLANAVTLNANGAYYIASYEAAGGDAWYDHVSTSLSTTTAAAVTGAAYRFNDVWTVIGGSGSSYAPVNLKYQGQSGNGENALVTGVSNLGVLRNDFGGFVGTKFTVGNAPMTVTHLGRYFVSGNSGSHSLKLVRVGDLTEVASTTINLSQGNTSSLGFRYAALSSAVSLTANTAYYLLSEESTGGDLWHDNIGTTVTTTSAASVASAVYFNQGYVETGNAGSSYVPLDLKYTTGVQIAPTFSTGGTATPNPGAQSFATSVSLGTTIRNDADGFIGFKFTVTTNPVTITHLGRYFLTGNTGSHMLKIIRVSDQAEVASVTVNMQIGSADALGYKYAALSSPVTLSANTAYYLVSQENAGGDQWYDNIGTTLSTTSVAAINSSVYAQGSGWVENGSPGSSYIPLNFRYQ